MLRFRPLRSVVIALTVFGALNFFSMEVAHADAQCGAPHCYGIAYLGVSAPSGFSGVDVHVRTNCMTVSDVTTELMTN